MKFPSPETITTAFVHGQGTEFQLSPEETVAMHAHLAVVGERLAELPQEQSFAWTEHQPTRHSCWLASKPGGDFIVNKEELAEFDGDTLAGRRGLTILGETALRQPLAELKRRADAVLQVSALAVGITEKYLEECAIRYRIIHYKGAAGGGIGVHFDGNALAAVQTDAPGLVELGYDGNVTGVNPGNVGVMPGSTLYRATSHRTEPYLPTFHGVQLTEEEHKTSMAAFLNLPDRAFVPAHVFGNEFYHDVSAIKQDDGPQGSLSHLWERMASAHDITVNDLESGTPLQMS